METRIATLKLDNAKDDETIKKESSEIEQECVSDLVIVLCCFRYLNIFFYFIGKSYD